MKINKSLALLAIGIACMGASAQDITIEEMQMLDQWRAQYAAKGVELKPEDEVRLLQRTRAMKAMAASQGSAGNQNGSGGSALGQMLMQRMQQQPQTQVASAPESSMPTISETDARKLLDALPTTQPLSSFERLRDGMKFNGQRYADPEGTAERFALDPDTATAAYVVPTGNYANVKIARLGSGSDPVTIGRLSKNGNRMVFQTSTGKTLSGDLFFPLTDGALLVRDSVGFRYVVGVGTKQIDFPAGWAPAPLQRGNASTTGWFLLERDTVEEKKSFFAPLKSIGQLAGALPASMDYALFDLNKRTMVPFEISTDGKSVASYSQCRSSSNGLVNLCDKMTTYDSIWKTDGSPNWMHYFWKIDWQKMGGTPVAVVMENGLSEVNGYDLSGSKKVNLLQRTLGINNWFLDLADEGKYRINAQLAFQKTVIDDVASELKTRPDVPRRQ